MWWGTSGIAAVADTSTGPVPALFGGWPLLPAPLPGHDAEAIAAILAATGGSAAETLLVVALPVEWGPARRTAWHQAAEGIGLAEIRTVPAGEIVHQDTDAALWTVHATIETGNDRCSVAAFQHTPSGPDQAAVITRPAGDAPADIIAAVTTAADTSPPTAVILIGQPDTTRDFAAGLDEMLKVREVTPLSLAAATLNHTTSDAEAPSVAPPPVDGVFAAVATGLLSLVLAVLVTGSATPAVNATERVVLFSPGHTGVAALGIAVTTIAAGMLAVHARLARDGTWNWATAGSWLIAAAGLGMAAAATVGLVLAASGQAQAQAPLLWSVLPTAPLTGAFAATGWVISRRPDCPPSRRIWPPMAAVILALIGVVVLHITEPVFAGMTTGSAFLARAGFITVAAATGIAVSTRTAVRVLVAAPLAVIYLATASPSTGTLACCLVIAAVTVPVVSAAVSLVVDQRRPPEPGGNRSDTATEAPPTTDP